MLELLHIENIAVIQEADIQFRPGFNALTGETGAGKSIVIDAMGAVLGGRTSRDLVRTGADRAFVSAEFSQVPGDLAGLAETGAAPDEDGHLLLQRELTGDGKNLCRVNGRPVTVAQLRRIGEELLNIHGQHDGQQLLDEEQHLSYLDRFGRTEAPLGRYQTAYEAMADLQAKIRALQMDEAEKARRMDSLRFQIDELERAQLVPGEEESLTERRDLLRNGEKYLSALSGADYCLNGGEEGGGAVSALRDAEEALAGVRTLSGDMGELYQRLEQLRCEAYDLAEIIRDKREAFDFSPAELDAVESRSDLLYRLKKKYGATVEEMLAYLDKCRRELDDMETADDTLARLEQQLEKARKAVLAAGAELTAARKEAAAVLEQRIQSELRDLDMHKVRFAIDFGEKEPGPDGCDAVRFLMSANAGEDLKPIARIASGGELARIMLEKRAGGAGVHRHAGVRRGGHRRLRPCGPEGGGEAGPGQPPQAGAVRDPPPAAGRHGGHPLLRGEGGARRSHLYPCGAAGPGAAEGGASPDHRRQPRDRGPAGKRRRVAGPGGALSERIRNEESCGMSNFWVRQSRTHSNCSACSRTHEFRTPN